VLLPVGEVLFLQFGDPGLAGGDFPGGAGDFPGEAVFQARPALRADGAGDGHRVGQIAFADLALRAVADVFALQVIAGDFGDALFHPALPGLPAFLPGPVGQFLDVGAGELAALDEDGERLREPPPPPRLAARILHRVSSSPVPGLSVDDDAEAAVVEFFYDLEHFSSFLASRSAARQRAWI
jgi:hypothetical protein